MLHFAPGETAAKTVYVLAPTDGVAEGDRKVVVSHSVISQDATFDNARVRNVEVQVPDIDQPAINLIAIDPATGQPDNQSLVLEGDATTGITDQYKVHLAIPPAAGTTVTVDITVGDPRVVLSSADARFATVTPRTATTPGVYRVTFTAGQCGRRARHDHRGRRCRGAGPAHDRAHARRQCGADQRRPLRQSDHRRQAREPVRQGARQRQRRRAGGAEQRLDAAQCQQPGADRQLCDAPDDGADRRREDRDPRRRPGQCGDRRAGAAGRHRHAAAWPVCRRGHLGRDDAHADPQRRRQLARRWLPRRAVAALQRRRRRRYLQDPAHPRHRGRQARPADADPARHRAGAGRRQRHSDAMGAAGHLHGRRTGGSRSP